MSISSEQKLRGSAYSYKLKLEKKVKKKRSSFFYFLTQSPYQAFSRRVDKSISKYEIKRDIINYRWSDTTKI